MVGKRKVIFICSRNAARSQMVEGFLRALYGDMYEASSAGLRPFTVSRTATRVMKEVDIDISSHRSKPVSELAGVRFDLVVALCDEAACTPGSLLPPGNQYLHKEFPYLATFGRVEGEILAAYRDPIGSWIRDEFSPRGSLGKKDPLYPPAPSPKDVKGETAKSM